LRTKHADHGSLILLATTGSDHGYHYLGSALSLWHLRMGGAFADAMLGMLE